MRALVVSSEITAQLIAHAQSEQPQEACGLLIGESNRVLQVIPLANEAKQPQHHFTITQAALNEHLPQIRANGLFLLGFYHSHPQGLPYPSQTDVVELAPFELVHIIIGLKNSQPCLGAWRIGSAKVESLEMVELALETHEAWTLSQKVAMIVSAIVSVVLFVVMALTLLPPAP